MLSHIGDEFYGIKELWTYSPISELKSVLRARWFYETEVRTKDTN